MNSFELKTAISASPTKIFSALTEPQRIAQWEHFRWAQSDMRTAGSIRKRDDEGHLWTGTIVIFEPPFRYGVLWPVPHDIEEPEEKGTFQIRMEYQIEAHGDKSMLTLKSEGFPTEELANREKNSWGGFYLEKLKKIAES